MNKARVIGIFCAIAGLLITVFAVMAQFELALATAGILFTLLTLVILLQQRQLLQRADSIRRNMQSDRRVLVSTIRQNEIRPIAGVTGVDSVNETNNNPRVGVKFEYAQRVLKSPSGLETYALRTKSVRLRDSFARAATNMDYDVADLLYVVRSLRAGKLELGKTAIKQWDSRVLCALARVMANQHANETDAEDAYYIFRFVEDLFGMKSFGRTDAYIYSEVCCELGDYSKALKILRNTKVANRDPVHYALVKANVHSSSNEPDLNRWLDCVNGLFKMDHLCGIELDLTSNSPLLDSLRPSSDVTKAISDGPTVSVIVPTFNGSASLETALRSLASQTWKNIEIIVVDDGSETSEIDAIRRLVLQFQNTKLITLEKNQGPYVARNVGLDHATGDFVTTHDDDDWSHPQKIEIQMNHLINNPNEVANMSRHARCSEDLQFSRINVNPSFSQPNFSSLLVRREVFDKIGRWDRVNRGGDAEFRDRLVKLQGSQIEVVGKAPVSFTRTHAHSLTAGEINRGYIDSSRLFYQAAYSHEHERTALEKITETNFARPNTMKAGNRNAVENDLDIIFATDFSFPGGTSQLTVREMQVAVERGMNIGLLHLPSPVNTGKASLSDDALRVATSENVKVLSLRDSVTADLLIVRHPTVVEFIECLESSICVSRAVLVVNNPPILNGGTGVVYDLRTSIANLTKLFSVEPDVLGESEVTRDSARAIFGSQLLRNETWPGILGNVSKEPRMTVGQRKPIVGRHSRDSKLKWPDALSTIEQLYTSNDTFNVRIMGGVDTLPPKAQKLLFDGADVYGFNEVPVSQFLSEIDFWVYFHSSKLTESFGMATAEAMLAGVVVILPHYMKSNFGEGAIYASPNEVEKLVAELWADREAYRAQAARGQRYAEKHFSADAFIDRVNTYKA